MTLFNAFYSGGYHAMFLSISHWITMLGVLLFIANSRHVKVTLTEDNATLLNARNETLTDTWESNHRLDEVAGSWFVWSPRMLSLYERCRDNGSERYFALSERVSRNPGGNGSIELTVRV
jgi:hypothetical protein